jgi:uncharacterized membrane protein YGL010W
MKTATDYLSEYAAYHRDRRNIAIHSVGIPLIVFALVILTSRPVLHLGPLTIWPAVVLLVVLDAFYLTLDRAFGLAFALAAVAMAYVALLVAAEPTPVWLAAGAGAFVVGWILQFIGHGYEGKKPAFLDDVMGLAVGPLFVTAEAFFAAGRKASLKSAIEARVGPSYIREATSKA